MIYLFVFIFLILTFLYGLFKPKLKKTSKTYSSIDFNSNQLKWEKVLRKSKRWSELGFGDGDEFPGYGKLYEREFYVWYCNIGSKEKQNQFILKDRFPLNYDPKNSRLIIGENVYLEQLINSKEYESLYTAVDNIKRIRWYFGLQKYTPTWIETDRAIEVESANVEEIEIPSGWKSISRQNIEFNTHDFPGYGKIYNLTLEVWYLKVGEKVKFNQPPVSAQLALYNEDSTIYNFNNICKKINLLNGIELNFERLKQSGSYVQKYTAIDHKTKKRWYFGIVDINPSYLFMTNE